MPKGKFLRLHFQCVKCGFVVVMLQNHLIKYHENEILESDLRNLEKGIELEKIFSEWFVETNDEITARNHRLYYELTNKVL